MYRSTFSGALILVLVIVSSFTLAFAKNSDNQNLSGTDIGVVSNDTIYVNLERIISTALQNNQMLAASQAMFDAASADALGAWQGFLPQLKLSEFYMRSDDALSSFGFKLQNRSVTAMDFNPVLLNNPGEINNFITRIQVLQPIFNGGMGIYGKQAANAACKAQSYKHQRAEETIRYNAIQAYEGLTLAEAFIRVLESAVTSASGHVRQAESMVNNEMATEADLLQAKVYLSTVQQKLIETRNMAAIAGENIKLLTAVSSNLPMTIEKSAVKTANYLPPSTINISALSNRSDLLAREAEVRAAGKMVGVAQGAMLPHVNLSVQKDWYDLEYLFGTDSNSWTMGVYATMGFGIHNVGEIKKAKAHKRAAAHMSKFESHQAQVEATQALLSTQAAYEKVLVARDAVEAAREGLRIVTNQYREGLASMVDLLDTQAYATMAEGNLVQAKHDLNVGIANLEFSGATAASTVENQ